MKPTRLLLNWLGVLLGLGILLGTATALQFKVPDTLHSIAWGLLLALLLLATLDAMRMRRRPSPRVQRQMPGSLALGRWGEVRLALEHDFPQPLTVQVFDHVPDGLTVENLPQSIDLRPGERRRGLGAAERPGGPRIPRSRRLPRHVKVTSRHEPLGVESNRSCRATATRSAANTLFPEFL